MRYKSETSEVVAHAREVQGRFKLALAALILDYDPDQYRMVRDLASELQNSLFDIRQERIHVLCGMAIAYGNVRSDGYNQIAALAESQPELPASVETIQFLNAYVKQEVRNG